MKGKINNFRQGRHHQETRHLIVTVDGVDTRKKAEKLLEKKVEWKTSTGKTIKGVVKALHGNKGAVRVLFEKGLPGQALGKEVMIA